MAKPKMPRITEPDEGLVHYQPDALSGNATLCGLTDFLGHKEHGKETNAPVDCAACIAIKKWCDAHLK